MKSCIFHGRLNHRRRHPVRHAFQYPLYMMYLDLAELDGLLARFWLWSARKTPWAAFRRSDHSGDPNTPLDVAVRDLIESRTGRRPSGPIRLLTQVSALGFRFNSVNFYYCFDSRDQRVETIVAEVTNTPWKEQHCYVLAAPAGLAPDEPMQFEPVKKMRVSPFIQMDVDYTWHFTPPSQRIFVNMMVRRGTGVVFDASLRLQRKEISAASLAWLQVAYPLMTLRAFAGIHWQALRLWLKGCRMTPLPEHEIEACELRSPPGADAQPQGVSK